MNQAKLASLLGVALTISSVTATAGVEYDDQALHRSDDLVRFDRAYRAGLQDGTTTIIYSGGGTDDGALNKRRDRFEGGSRATEDQPYPGGNNRDNRDRYAGNFEQQGDRETDHAREYDIPEKMQDPSRAEERRYPNRSDRYGESQWNDNCDCDEGKPTAPRSRPVTPSVPVEPETEATMRDKIEAVRQARELLRRSRSDGDFADVETDGLLRPEPSSEYGSDTPRLIDHAKTVTPNVAPLTPYELDPDHVRNQEVSIDIDAATIEEIATAIMPRGWRVRLSTSDKEVHEAKYEFVSSDPREVALRKLLLGTGLGYKFFFNLKNEQGKPSPLLVISEVKS